MECAKHGAVGRNSRRLPGLAGQVQAQRRCIAGMAVRTCDVLARSPALGKDYKQSQRPLAQVVGRVHIVALIDVYDQSGHPDCQIVGLEKQVAIILNQRSNIKETFGLFQACWCLLKETSQRNLPRLLSVSCDALYSHGCTLKGGQT
jgi:hypothetical protein